MTVGTMTRNGGTTGTSARKSGLLGAGLGAKLVKGGLMASLLLTAVGCDNSADDSTAIGPRGGIVTSEDGRVTLEVPAGALADEVEISIERIEDAPEGSVGPAYAIEPYGLTFSQPAELTYDASHGMQADVSDCALVIEHDEQRWNDLADRDVDPSLGEVTASVLYLSTIAIVAD